MNQCHCCKKEFPERLETLRDIDCNGVMLPVCSKCDHTEEGRLLQAMKEEKTKDADPNS